MFMQVKQNAEENSPGTILMCSSSIIVTRLLSTLQFADPTSRNTGTSCVMTLHNLKEAEWCCGSAGIYNITNQEIASQLLERKMNNIIATGANMIATGNPGCMMQIALGAKERGIELEVVHPVQLLDEAYQAGGLYNVPVRNTDAAWRRQRTLAVGIGVGILIGFLLARRRQRKV